VKVRWKPWFQIGTLATQERAVRVLARYRDGERSRIIYERIPRQIAINTTPSLPEVEHARRTGRALTRRWLVGLLGLVVVLGCSVSSASARSHPLAQPVSYRIPLRRSVAPLPFRARLIAATHRPKVNAPWPFTVRVTDLSGRPLRATLHMQILYGGAVVGQVDTGARYTFVGSWHERKGQEVTWPAESRGTTLVFEVVVTAKHRTTKLDYWIQAR
jgi:hypothetical protein